MIVCLKQAEIKVFSVLCNILTRNLFSLIVITQSKLKNMQIIVYTYSRRKGNRNRDGFAFPCKSYETWWMLRSMNFYWNFICLGTGAFRGSSIHHRGSSNQSYRICMLKLLLCYLLVNSKHSRFRAGNRQPELMFFRLWACVKRNRGTFIFERIWTLRGWCRSCLIKLFAF